MRSNAREPGSATPLVDGQTETTPWAVARERLEHPAAGQNHWLATVAPDGRQYQIDDLTIERGKTFSG